MGYVVAGYVIVLSLLFLYALRLTWRRRRLTRAVDRVVAARTLPHESPRQAAGPSAIGGER